MSVLMVLKGRKSRVRDETRPMAPKPKQGWRNDFRFSDWGQPIGAFEKKGPLQCSYEAFHSVCCCVRHGSMLLLNLTFILQDDSGRMSF